MYMGLWARCKSLVDSALHRKKMEREMEDELRFHVARYVEDLVRSGILQEQAIRMARIEFGAAETVKDECRQALGLRAWDELRQDLQYSTRMLRKHPGFAAIAILNLALGIGVNSTVFSIINRILLRPLPVSHPAELVMLNMAKGPNIVPTFSYPDYQDLRDRSRTFSGLAAYRFVPMSLRAGDSNSLLWGYLVSGNYFQMLGVDASLGRTITPADDTGLSAHPVIVLSDACWQRRFGGALDIAGRTVKINGIDYRIVGVAPRRFTGTELFYTPEVYVPMSMARQIEPAYDWIERRQSGTISLLGRLRPGVQPSRAESELDSMAAELGRQYPITDGGMRIRLSPPGLAGSFMRGRVIAFTRVFLGVTALVLLIACVNLAGLLLARASDRRRECAVRLGLGAGRQRLIRQMLIENLALSSLGGAAGLAVAVWLTGAVAAWRPPAGFPLDLSAGMDGTVVAFTFVTSLLAAPVFGLVPALQATRGDLAPAVKNGGNGNRLRWGLLDGMVAAQVTLSVVLLAGSALVLRSLRNALEVHLGFEPQGGAVVAFDLGLHGYDKARGRDFQRHLLAKVGNLPGVQAVGLADRLPLGLDSSRYETYIDGQPAPKPGEAPLVCGYDASPGFFRAMGTTLLAGRDFEARDGTAKGRLAIVNQAFADRLLPGEQPLGHRFRFMRGGEPREIIGVVETGKQFSLGEGPEPAVWELFDQDYSAKVTVVARSTLPDDQLLVLLRSAVLDLDPGLAFYQASTLTDHLRLPLFPARVAASALAVFGALALLLAAIGVYGLMAYAVARRTREIGIRVALGARQSDVLRIVVRRAGFLLATGLTLGVAAATAVGPWYAAILYNTSPRDPVTLLIAVGLILLTGLCTCLLPARRALKIVPASALREE
jgi:predicted permease